MKKLGLLFASLLMLLAQPALAATTGCFQNLNGVAYGNVTARSGTTYTTDAYGQVCGVAASDSGSLLNSGYMAVGTQQGAVSFTNTLIGNPNVMMHVEDVPLAQVSGTTKTVFASAAGRTIYIGEGLTMYASGTMATATAMALKCSGGNSIVSFAAAVLTDQAAVGPFISGATRGAALVKGCPVGESVLMSATGVPTTTTDFFISIPYSVQ